MEDGKVRLIAQLKKVGVILLAIVIISIIVILGYQFVMKKINTDKFTDYLSNNGFELKKDGTYLKEDKNGDIITRYKALSADSIISKETYETTDIDYTTFSFKYEKNGNIQIGLQFEGYNKHDNYGTLYQTGNYKNGEFDCKIVTGKGFEPKCDIMKNKAKEFNNEVNNIIEKSEANPKYISQKSNSK